MFWKMMSGIKTKMISKKNKMRKMYRWLSSR